MNTKKTRWVKRLEDGSYTMESAAMQVREIDICDSCGINDVCPIYRMVKKVENIAQVGIRKCKRYFPLIGFRPPIVGLNGVFNTLRVGETWMTRVEPGTLVTLINTVNNEVLGYAKVVRLHTGPFDEMVKKHAHRNHIGKSTTDNPIETVNHVLRKAHGHFLNDDSRLTAIYLERVEDSVVRDR